MFDIKLFREIIGYIAMAIYLIAYSAQMNKTIKRKVVTNLSLVAFVGNFTGAFLGIIQGILAQDIQSAMSNLAQLVFVPVIIFMILKSDERFHKNAKGVALISMGALTLVTTLLAIIDASIQFIPSLAPNGSAGQAIDHASFYINIIAGSVGSLAYVPQTIKLVKTKKGGDISYVLLISLIVGQFCGLSYRIAQMASGEPVIKGLVSLIFGCISFTSQTTLTALKVYYNRKAKANGEVE